MGPAVARAAATAVLPGQAPPAVQQRRPARPAGNAAVLMRKTLDGLKAYPFWYRRVPAVTFFGIIGILLLGLLAGVVAIRNKHASLRPVDPRAEARFAKERQLRSEGNNFILQARDAEAHAKLQ